MTYIELLQDPRWQRRRLERLGAENFTCERCGATHRTLHVHHRRYRAGAMPWEYGDDELAVLCTVCHDLEHGKGVERSIFRGLLDLVARGRDVYHDDEWVRLDRVRYFANPDPTFEASRARQLAELRRRMAA